MGQSCCSANSGARQRPRRKPSRRRSLQADVVRGRSPILENRRASSFDDVGGANASNDTALTLRSNSLSPHVAEVSNVLQSIGTAESGSSGTNSSGLNARSNTTTTTSPRSGSSPRNPLDVPDRPGENASERAAHGRVRAGSQPQRQRSSSSRKEAGLGVGLLPEQGSRRNSRRRNRRGSPAVAHHNGDGVNRDSALGMFESSEENYRRLSGNTAARTNSNDSSAIAAAIDAAVLEDAATTALGGAGHVNYLLPSSLTRASPTSSHLSSSDSTLIRTGGSELAEAVGGALTAAGADAAIAEAQDAPQLPPLAPSAVPGTASNSTSRSSAQQLTGGENFSINSNSRFEDSNESSGLGRRASAPAGASTTTPAQAVTHQGTVSFLRTAVGPASRHNSFTHGPSEELPLISTMPRPSLVVAPSSPAEGAGPLDRRPSAGVPGSAVLPGRHRSATHSAFASPSLVTPTSSGSRDAFDDLHSDSLSVANQRDWNAVSGVGRKVAPPTEDELFSQLRWNGVLTQMARGGCSAWGPGGSLRGETAAGLAPPTLRSSGVQTAEKRDPRRQLVRGVFLWIRSFQILLSASQSVRQRCKSGGALEAIKTELVGFKAAASSFINDTLVECLLGFVPHSSLIRLLDQSKRLSAVNSSIQSSTARNSIASTVPYCGTPSMPNVSHTPAPFSSLEIGDAPSALNIDTNQSASALLLRSQIASGSLSEPSAFFQSSGPSFVATSPVTHRPRPDLQASPRTPLDPASERNSRLNAVPGDQAGLNTSGSGSELESNLLREARRLSAVTACDAGLLRGPSSSKGTDAGQIANYLRTFASEVDAELTLRAQRLALGGSPLVMGVSVLPSTSHIRTVLPGLFIGVMCAGGECARMIAELNISAVVCGPSDFAAFQHEAASSESAPVLTTSSLNSSARKGFPVWRFENFCSAPVSECRLPGQSAAVRVGSGGDTGALATVDIVNYATPDLQRNVVCTLTVFSHGISQITAQTLSPSSASSPTSSSSPEPCLTAHLPSCYAFIQEVYVRKRVSGVLVLSRGVASCASAAVLSGYIAHVLQVQLSEAVDAELKLQPPAIARVGSGGPVTRAIPRWESALAHALTCSTSGAQQLQQMAVGLYKNSLALVGAPLPNSIAVESVSFDDRINVVPLAISLVTDAAPLAIPSESQCFALLKVHSPWTVLTAFERDMESSTSTTSEFSFK